MTISVELPRENGELVMKALEYAMADMESNNGAERVSDEDEKPCGVDYGDALEAAYSGEESRAKDKDSLFQRQADALVKVAQGYLAGGKEKTTCTADHYQGVVHMGPVGEKNETHLLDVSLRGLEAERPRSVTEALEGTL